jgi:hypothetical protein
MYLFRNNKIPVFDLFPWKIRKGKDIKIAITVVNLFFKERFAYS